MKYADMSDPLLPSGSGPFFSKWLLIWRLSRLHDAVGAKAGDFIFAIADLSENLLGVLAKHR